MISKKTDFFLKLLEPTIREMFAAMDVSEQRMARFQMKRMVQSLIVFVSSAVLSLFYTEWLIAVGLGLAAYLYTTERKKIIATYENHCYYKNLEFNKFMRLINPYLLQNNSTVYFAFSEMRKRLSKGGYVKKALERLMRDMIENPNSEEPFVKFAQEASGTNEAEMSMMAIYDYQQNSNNKAVIVELGKRASERFFESVDGIVRWKCRKFYGFPSRLTMLSLIIIIGFMVCSSLYAFSEFRM